jgi:hypothetical protein
LVEGRHGAEVITGDVERKLKVEFLRQSEELIKLVVNCDYFVVVELILSETGGSMSVIGPGLHRDGLGAGAEANFGGY